MTAELTAFLEARLDERESAAVAAGGRGGDWQALGTGVYSVPVDEDAPPLVTTGPEVGGTDEDAARAEHVALHDPTRVLREVEAARRVLRAHEQWCEGRCETKHPEGGFDAAHYWSVKSLAAVYADHPDHREEWRP
ncbi:DUF6221 family protein [Streptomyces sp. NPDC102473]|uniref:DUF6221 family protein n=1 Tax=Streptomyces sp. NPDC102473 TaxID=3366180 RepID=UPI00382D823A